MNISNILAYTVDAVEAQEAAISRTRAALVQVEIPGTKPAVLSLAKSTGAAQPRAAANLRCRAVLVNSNNIRVLYRQKDAAAGIASRS